MAPESVLSLEVPPHNVDEVDIRLRTAFDNRVDADKRKIIVQTTTPYNVSPIIHMLQVLVQCEIVAAEIELFSQSFSPLEK